MSLLSPYISSSCIITAIAGKSAGHICIFFYWYSSPCVRSCRQMKDQTKKMANLKHKEQLEKSRNAQLMEDAKKREDNLNESSQQIKVKEGCCFFSLPPRGVGWLGVRRSEVAGRGKCQKKKFLLSPPSLCPALNIVAITTMPHHNVTLVTGSSPRQCQTR